MPNGSLDARIFCPSEKGALGWNLRYKILSDVSLTKPMPSEPVMSADLDISQVVKDESYFGFAASTGTYVELNCVLAWNLTVENLTKDNKLGIILALGIGLPAALVILGVGCWGVAMHRRQVAANDPNILGALKSFPETPREFSFKELKKGTNNFDDKQRLGEGGFGVVYKDTLLPKENNLEIAVKKFNRDKIKSKDDFLVELTIINRLRHKHLVQLLGFVASGPNPSKIRASGNLAMGWGGLKRAGQPTLLSSVS
ncbi:hypothetical protein CDL15_Pgr004853 [Punica granatum]|uniref:Protein kinase domain-containing protein n=1 Tax=Punica granatum TaxID=22663 RepID=A0A218W848_PUNGR|nr:hypothetical protein CDL15_Pgr004853 [Punica granatum]